MSFKETARKIWFKNSRWSRLICPCCGFRFELDETITKISIGETEEYFHDDCFAEMTGQEALEHMGAEIEEVEL